MVVGQQRIVLLVGLLRQERHHAVDEFHLVSRGFEAFEGGGQLGGKELGEQFGDVVVVLFENFFLPLRAFGDGAAHERCALEVFVEPQGESFVSRGHRSSLAARAVCCCLGSHRLTG